MENGSAGKKPSLDLIAKMAGCSKGTVDRAINDRGGINKETKKESWKSWLN